MIELHITCAGKGYSPKDKFSIFDEHRKTFATIKEAKSYLRDTYGKCKRVPMFIDTADGRVKRIGYVYGFRNADLSHAPVHRWIQQDWVEFRESNSINPGD